MKHWPERVYLGDNGTDVGDDSPASKPVTGPAIEVAPKTVPVPVEGLAWRDDLAWIEEDAPASTDTRIAEKVEWRDDLGWIGAGEPTFTADRTTDGSAEPRSNGTEHADTGSPWADPPRRRPTGERKPAATDVPLEKSAPHDAEPTGGQHTDKADLQPFAMALPYSDATPARPSGPPWAADRPQRPGAVAAVLQPPMLPEPPGFQGSPGLSRPAVADRLRDLADSDDHNGIGRRLFTMVRAATGGLVDPGAMEAQGVDRALVDAVRLPQPRPRVIGVLSGKGGTGATTTAAGVALTLAALRDDDTLLVDARSGSASLATRLTGRVAPNVADLIRDPYLTPLATPTGLRVLDGTPWFDAAGEDLVTVLEPLTVRNGFTVVDLGNDVSGGAGSALAAADQLVVVTGTDQTSLAATRITFERIGPEADGARLANAVVVVVCTRPGTHARIGRTLRGEISADVARIVTVPYDRALASGGPLDMSRLNRRTRRAYLTITALLGDPR